MPVSSSSSSRPPEIQQKSRFSGVFARSSRALVAALVAFVMLGGIGSEAQADSPDEAPDGAWDAAAVHTFNGAILGLYVCEAQGYCGNDEETASVILGGAIGGIGGYVIGGLFPRQHVMMTNTGMIFGHFAGIATAELAIEAQRDADNWDYDSDSVHLQHRLVGELIGGLAFGGFSVWFDPAPSQVAMANSVGMWSLWLAGLGQLSRDRSPGLYGAGATFLVGFAGGMMLWEELGFSRLSLWMVDVGGILGAIGGGIYASADQNGHQVVQTSLFVGTALGLAAGTWLAWDEPREGPAMRTVSMFATPRRGGGVVGLQGAF